MVKIDSLEWQKVGTFGFNSDLQRQKIAGILEEKVSVLARAKIKNKRVAVYLTDEKIALNSDEFKKLPRLYSHKLGSTKEHWDARLSSAATNLKPETQNIKPALEVWYVSIGDDCYETYLRFPPKPLF